jgi:hypothetical protein
MSALNLLVFRGDQRRASGQDLKTALASQLERLCGCYSHEALVGSLLLAGELECCVADADREAARPVEILTDRIAEALLLDESGFNSQTLNSQTLDSQTSNFQSLADAARALPALEQLSISTPEGFAYYALHPLAYADVVRKIPACESLLVVGIRSIGTTLSAVAAAAARRRGMKVRRLTVRPQGHPYNRRTEFLPQELAIARRAVSSGATFAIVDEGPGLSGSSFLSVAEALEQAGAPREKIILVSSHAPNIDALCAADAARRWRRYGNVWVPSEPRRPAQAVNFISGGQWRGIVPTQESEWPAAWTSFERLKYLSSGERHEPSTGHREPRLFKFAGLGHYGDQVLEREQKVAAAGFGPLPQHESDGFVSYPWMDGRPLSANDLSPEILARLAAYCAFRLRACACAMELSGLSALQQMAEHNLRELGFHLAVVLRLERPVLADGRMQPHEWLPAKEGLLLKLDSGSHGDDHFFPGPTDIAWDLAGAIVEWRMSEQLAREFLDLYRHASGDDASGRIDGFIRAYAVFRSAYCMMAANAMSGSHEQTRLDRAAAIYRSVLTKMAAHISMAPSSLSASTS